MMLSQFLVKTVRMLDRQIMVHDLIAHGTHLVQAYTMVCLGVEYTVSSGRRGMLNQPKNREMKAIQLLDGV